MGEIQFIINKNDVEGWLSSKQGDLYSKFGELIKDVTEDFSLLGASLAPMEYGDLFRSHTYEVSGFNGVAYATAPHFRFVIEGTAAHGIGSNVWLFKVGHWMWFGPPGREHPGTKANDYMADAAAEGMGTVEDRCTDFLNWLVE